MLTDVSKKVRVLISGPVATELNCSAVRAQGSAAVPSIQGLNAGHIMGCFPFLGGGSHASLLERRLWLPRLSSCLRLLSPPYPLFTGEAPA